MQAASEEDDLDSSVVVKEDLLQGSIGKIVDYTKSLLTVCCLGNAAGLPEEPVHQGPGLRGVPDGSEEVQLS